MKLRQRIDAILLTAALSALLPVGTLYAAEAVHDTASADIPRLIDPQSPPPSERQQGSTAPPIAPAGTISRTPDARVQPPPAETVPTTTTPPVRRPAADNNPAPTHPAPDHIELLETADVPRNIPF